MASILDLVKHYQHAIEKYPSDEQKIVKSIDKLFNLGVTVQHLQETGVGRTVNALRKEPGHVGQAARALVYKWKLMVAAEESDHDEDHNQSSTYNGHENGKSSEDSDNDSKHKQNQYNKYGRIEKEEETYSNSKYVNGDYSGSKRKHQSSEDEEPHVKKSKHKTTHNEVQEELTHISVKREPLETEPDSFSHSDEDRDNDLEESCEENKLSRHKFKTEHKSDLEESCEEEKLSGHKYKTEHISDLEESCEEDKLSRNKYKTEHKRSSSTKHSDRKEKHKKDSSSGKLHENLGKHSRHSHSESRHVTEKSSKDSKSSGSDKHRKEKDSSSQKKESSDHKSSDKDKKKKEIKEESSSKHSSSSEKRKSNDHSEKSSNKSEKHNSSSQKEKSDKDKHKHSSHKSSDKHKSRDHSSSKDKHSSSKEKSTKEKSSSSDCKENSDKNDKKRSPSSDTIAKENSSKSKREKNDDNKRSHDDKKKKSHSRSSHSSKSSKSSSSKSKDTPKKKTPKDSGEDGIDCGSGASFAEALGMISPSKPKKKFSSKDTSYSPNNSGSNDDMTPAALLAPNALLAPLPALEISALPEISPNYKPRPPPKFLPHFTEEDAISAGISSKNQRTKVYSGNKVLGKIPTLYEMCVQILQEHIDALEYTGGVPYEILKPVVDKATPQQLYMLEHFNPYLMEDTDHLWQKFCEKSFRNKKRQELESWREMYIRCQEEQEHRLKSLTANIRIAQEAKKAPIKQTKMAYVDTVVKPPRNIARKQAQHGTAFAASASPAARVAALAAAPNVLKGAARPSPVCTVPSSTFQKPKKAPLMQKALQFMRGRKR